jgi:hypothetical protein
VPSVIKVSFKIDKITNFGGGYPKQLFIYTELDILILIGYGEHVYFTMKCLYTRYYIVQNTDFQLFDISIH